MPSNCALPTNSTKRLDRREADRSDPSLLARIAHGDQNALQVLFTRHSTRIHRYVTRLTGSATTAEESVSDVFLEVWTHAGDYSGRSRVSTWLMGIARHKALSAVRQRSEVQLDERFASFIEDPAEGPEEILLTRSRETIIANCIGQLPRMQREVIDLFYLRGKSVSEVVEIVGASKSTVKTRMFYGRSRMAELLEQAGIESARA